MTIDCSAMRYPGGKFRCYQKLISLMPPHRVYIESHLGGGAVLRHKLPAEENVGIDVDPAVIKRFRGFSAGFTFVNQDAVEYLSQRTFAGDELIYADPPYPEASLRGVSPYRHRYSDADHAALLRVLRSLPCMVMISSYSNAFYEEVLADWHRIEFLGTTHAGSRVECVWMNFQPSVLHDTRYIGWDFRGRQAWKRKCERWKRRFALLSPPEQQALLAELHLSFSKPQEAAHGNRV